MGNNNIYSNLLCKICIIKIGDILKLRYLVIDCIGKIVEFTRRLHCESNGFTNNSALSLSLLWISKTYSGLTNRLTLKYILSQNVITMIWHWRYLPMNLKPQDSHFTSALKSRKHLFNWNRDLFGFKYHCHQNRVSPHPSISYKSSSLCFQQLSVPLRLNFNQHNNVLVRCSNPLPPGSLLPPFGHRPSGLVSSAVSILLGSTHRLFH